MVVGVQIWTYLKNNVGEIDVDTEVRRVAITKEMNAAIFDVPKAKVDIFLELSKKSKVSLDWYSQSCS